MEDRTINPWNGSVPQPIRSDGAGAIDAGPRNIMRDIQNPDMLIPPSTDTGLLPNLKFSFSDTSMKLKKEDCPERLLRGSFQLLLHLQGEI